jgi:glycosyltransferase involved in cell wall biosynthesis
MLDTIGPARPSGPDRVLGVAVDPNEESHGPRPLVSVVIAAHDEEAVIGRTLDVLLSTAQPGELDVTVVANGCSDATSTVATKRPGVRVIEIPTASKPSALNAADRVVRTFPRIYLDADIAASSEDVRRLAMALVQTPGALAAYPDRRMDVRSSSLLVKAYCAISTRLPVFRSGLFGRGMVALTEAGRSRFDDFPEMVADDLFLDSLFGSSEKQLVTDVVATVVAPHTVPDLVRRLIRVRRGNVAMRGAAPVVVSSVVRSADRWSWLRDVVVPRPWLAPAAVVYVAVTLVAAARARRGEVRDMAWGRDESTRAGHADAADSPGGP